MQNLHVQVFEKSKENLQFTEAEVGRRKSQLLKTRSSQISAL